MGRKEEKNAPTQPKSLSPPCHRPPPSPRRPAAAHNTSGRNPRAREGGEPPEPAPMAWGVTPRPPSSKVQALYELCKRTFPSPSAAGAASAPPPAPAISSISSLLGNLLLPASNRPRLVPLSICGGSSPRFPLCAPPPPFLALPLNCNSLVAAS
jgi:hypothetical protein